MNDYTFVKAILTPPQTRLNVSTYLHVNNMMSTAQRQAIWGLLEPPPPTPKKRSPPAPLLRVHLDVMTELVWSPGLPPRYRKRAPPPVRTRSDNFPCSANF